MFIGEVNRRESCVGLKILFFHANLLLLDFGDLNLYSNNLESE